LKLIIQIPCLNEEATLESVVDDLPKKIDGINSIEYLVIDDGSTDNTVQVAKSLGVHHIEELGTNRGLARAFEAGVERALKEGADIIVNTDGDNQYCGDGVVSLVEPIRDNKADMVIGCRPIINHPEFSGIKKFLQLLGSYVLRRLSKTTVKDAASGFRAISRETALKMIVHTNFSYTMETLIQAGVNGSRVLSRDIKVKPKTRESRLYSSLTSYLKKSTFTMLSMALYYRPSVIFNSAGFLLLLSSLFIGGRFLYLVYFINSPDPERTYLPSLILLAVLSIGAFILFLLGFLGELISKQRRLTETILKEIKLMKYGK